MFQYLNKILILFTTILVLYYVFLVFSGKNTTLKVLSITESSISINHTSSVSHRIVYPTKLSQLEELFGDGTAMDVSGNIESSCKIVVCSIGNLGNQIWEYMSLFVVWKKYILSGYKPHVEENMWNNLKVLFPKLSILPGTYSLCDYPRERIIAKQKRLDFYRNWFNVRNSHNCKNIYLDEYSSRYDEILEYGVDKIRKEMSFAPHLVTECQDVLHRSRQYYNLSEDATFVGIHYRGTDYEHHLHINYASYNPKIPTYKYYIDAMKYFTEKYKNVIFMLVTIDQIWLEKNREPILNNSKVIVNPTRHIHSSAITKKLFKL